MRTVTVSQVNEYIARKLRDDINLRGLSVVGEISGLSKSGAHYYLTLKDENSLIRCAIWGSNARNIDMSLLSDGNKIIATGDISPYSKGGNYSLSIRHIEALGMGDLAKEFERVKRLLLEEGLFDAKYKKPVPEFPRRIGIVTSDTGAAIEDIKKIITSKNNYTDILIFPTLVQGIGAPDSIIRSIENANRLSRNGVPIDTLIVGRGGGSKEDLIAFNDEGVARAIFASEIPVISAVGHESDVSISDFVADMRAETPTAAADMAVMNTFELMDEIEYLRQQLFSAIKSKSESEHRILDGAVMLLKTNILSRLEAARHEVEKAAITIRENSPEVIMSKGYGAVMDSEGKLISDISGIEEDNCYTIRMKNGSFTAKVVSKEMN